MNTMSEKAQSDTGNHFCILCNAKLWQDINLVLGEYLAKVYVQSKNRPIYILKEHLGKEDEND